MGSGKSTIARALHKKSRKMILDSDVCIAFSENSSISDIFQNYGESYFRELERDFCRFVAQNVQNAIISTGGGMPMFCDVKTMGKVFFLHLEFEAILARLNAEELSKRPLFAQKDSAHKLYNERLQTYKNSAHHCIDATRSIAQITAEIHSLL